MMGCSIRSQGAKPFSNKHAGRVLDWVHPADVPSMSFATLVDNTGGDTRQYGAIDTWSKTWADATNKGAPGNTAEEAGAIAIWAVAADIPIGDEERYARGWFNLIEDDRQRYRRMARACITAFEAAAKNNSAN